MLLSHSPGSLALRVVLWVGKDQQGTEKTKVDQGSEVWQKRSAELMGVLPCL